MRRASNGLELATDVLGASGILSRVNKYIRARLGKCDRNRLTYSARRAGDDRGELVECFFIWCSGHSESSGKYAGRSFAM